jgi:hypothetical protein
MDTINHFLCHLVSCAVVPAARHFPCHQHVHNILYMHTTNKPTRHHYFTPLIITFTTLLLVDGTVKYNRPLSKFPIYKLPVSSSARHCSFYCQVFMANKMFSIVLLVFLCFLYCFSSSECYFIVSWDYWRLLLQCNCLNHYVNNKTFQPDSSAPTDSSGSLLISDIAGTRSNSAVSLDEFLRWPSKEKPSRNFLG